MVNWIEKGRAGYLAPMIGAVQPQILSMTREYYRLETNRDGSPQSDVSELLKAGLEAGLNPS